MNKQLLTLAAAMLCIGQATAQKQYELTASSHWQYSQATSAFAPVDSAAYTHSNGRNSMPQILGPYYQGSDDNYDKADIYTYRNGGYKDTLRKTIQFNTAGLRTETKTELYTLPSLPEDQYREQFTYTTVGGKQMLETRTEQFNNGGTWENMHRDHHYYLATAKIQHRINDQWDPLAGKWFKLATDTMWFDANDNMISRRVWLVVTPTPVIQENYTYTYDANGRLLTDTSYSNFAAVHVTSRIYNTAGLLQSITYYAKDQGNNWLPNNTNLYSYDAQSNVDTVKSLVWDGTGSFTPYFCNTYTYNNTNQVSRALMGLGWGGTAYSQLTDATTIAHFYYGVFPVGVQQATQGNLAMSVYPSPAVSDVHVSLNLPDARSISGYIISADGKVVRQWADAATKQYNKRINIAELPAGTYNVSILAGHQPISKTFIIVR